MNQYIEIGGIILALLLSAIAVYISLHDNTLLKAEINALIKKADFQEKCAIKYKERLASVKKAAAALGKGDKEKKKYSDLLEKKIQEMSDLLEKKNQEISDVIEMKNQDIFYLIEKKNQEIKNLKDSPRVGSPRVGSPRVESPRVGSPRVD